MLNNPDFVLGNGGHGGVLWAGVLEVLLALACIGTAVVLYPVARRQSETAALGCSCSGPGLIPAVNALCLGYVLYRSGLVPRIIPALGLFGAPLLAIFRNRAQDPHPLAPSECLTARRPSAGNR